MESESKGWCFKIADAFLMAEGTKLDLELPLEQGQSFINVIVYFVVHEREQKSFKEQMVLEKVLPYMAAHKQAINQKTFFRVKARYDPSFYDCRGKSFLWQKYYAMLVNTNALPRFIGT